MAYLAIIHVKLDGHLLAFNCLVGYARIVQIDNKVNIHQALDKLPIVQLACKHCTIEGVLALYQQLFYPLLVS
jgi:hypothetical protein